MADKIEDLPIFSRAIELCDAATAILKAKVYGQNRNAFTEIADAVDSITANMREGFELGSDDQFTKFLGYSKGSMAEVVERLKRCEKWGYVTPADVAPIESMAEELGKMLGGFIKYLRRCRFNNRGAFRARPPRRRA